MPETDELLDVLACDFASRPRGAATIDDVAPHVRAVRRDPLTLVIEFEDSARDAVRDFVAAEQRCCAGLGWHLQQEPALELRIDASPAQLDILQQLLPPSH
jgi:hypothetical protein